jgi:hypothetical protein
MNTIKIKNNALMNIRISIKPNNKTKIKTLNNLIKE